MADTKKNTDNSTLVQPVIEALLDTTQVFPARYLTFFSDISRPAMQALREAWPSVPVERKISLLSDLETFMEADSLLSFDEVAKFALDDEDPHVRSRAISLLWESDDSRFVEKLSEMLDHDPSELVQISAAAGLGRFVLMGELDEIPEKSFERALSSLRNKELKTPHKEIQQEILKSLAYTGSREINSQIQRAYEDPDPTWQLAAIIAMGRTADERWEMAVLDAMNSSIIAIQNEAVKAAGEIELESARLPLLEMLESGIADFELRLHVIWALAHIGGEDVKEALNNLLEEADDDEEISVIEMALEHLEFSEELPDLDL
jgi:HEAT repeat protein